MPAVIDLIVPAVFSLPWGFSYKIISVIFYIADCEIRLHLPNIFTLLFYYISKSMFFMMESWIFFVYTAILIDKC